MFREIEHIEYIEQNEDMGIMKPWAWYEHNETDEQNDER